MAARRIPVRHGTALWRYPVDGPVEARLICFPHAGGGAFLYRKWQERLPASVELVTVELAGRGTRLREAPATDLRAVALDVLPEVLSLADKPFALFGHSLGALLAFELALGVQKAGHAPLGVCVAASGAPARFAGRGKTSDLPDDAFIAHFERLGAMPREVMADPDLRAMALRVLRADMRMLETYVCDAGAALDCPVWAIGGHADDVATARDLLAWRAHAASGFEHRMFPGDHFFVQSQEALVVDYVGAQIEEALFSRAP